MAWTTPRTWTDGEVVNASLLNAQIRDNLEEVSPAVLASAYAPILTGGKGLIRVVNRADFASLAAAITAAGSGGTVVYPDDTTWDEPHTTITTPIKFAGRATIRKSANGPMFTVQIDSVKFAGELILDGRGSVYTGPGIVVTGNGTTPDLLIESELRDSDGPWVDCGIGAAQRGHFYSTLAYCRQRSVADCSATASSTTITSATAAFTSNDVGKLAYILNAQDTTAGNYHMAKIVSVTNATTAVLDYACGNTVAGTTLEIISPVYRFGAEKAAGVNGDRNIAGAQCAGGPLIDVGGAQNLNISDTGSRGWYFSDPDCAKVNCAGPNRIASTGAETRVRGTQHVISTGSWGGTLRFMSNSNSCAEGANVIAGGIVIDEGAQNKIGTVANPPMAPHTLDPRMLNATTTLNANQAVYLRVKGKGWISKIALHVNVSSGNIDVGVYASDLGAPGSTARPTTRKASSGSVVCPAAGAAVVALSTPVYCEEGDWLALVVDNATASFYRGGAGGFSTTLANGFSHHQSAAFPLPATATPSTGADYSVILVGTV